MGDRRRLPPAVTVFPLLVLAGGALGALVPGWFHPLAGGLPWLLGFVMLCMGVTIAPDDLRHLARRPWMVLIGLLAHYVIMPLVGWGVAAVLHLPPMLAVGVILVGCAPSGTASNVICFLAGGDVALSVSISIVSTLAAPIFMPLLTHLLAGAWVQVPVGSMMGDVLRTVVAPVVVGALLRWLLPGMVRRVAPVLPWISAVAVAGIVAVVVSGSAAALLASGGLALLAVVLH
ncbi:MAG: bile acid:sodium symporter family protein, partial [Pseudoclavibacter sp.]